MDKILVPYLPTETASTGWWHVHYIKEIIIHFHTTCFFRRSFNRNTKKKRGKSNYHSLLSFSCFGNQPKNKMSTERRIRVYNPVQRVCLLLFRIIFFRYEIKSFQNQRISKAKPIPDPIQLSKNQLTPREIYNQRKHKTVRKNITQQKSTYPERT